MAGGRARTLLSRAYLAVVAVVFAAAVLGSRDELARLLRDASLPLLALALVASYGQLTLTSAFWRSALASFGEPVPYRDSLVATLGSLPSRYLPGGVWYAVSRVARLHRSGARRSTLGAVAALETALMPAVGLTLGAVLVLLTSGELALSPFARASVGAAAVVFGAATTPPVVNRLLRLLARLRPSIGVPPRLGWGAHLRLVAWGVAFWTWSGSVFALYLAAFPALDEPGPVAVAGAYMVAWGVGWLAVFAPQGIGVFEVTLAALLVGGIGGVAVVIAGYRAIIAVRDVLAGGLALALGPARATESASTPET